MTSQEARKKAASLASLACEVEKPTYAILALYYQYEADRLEELETEAAATQVLPTYGI